MRKIYSLLNGKYILKGDKKMKRTISDRMNVCGKILFTAVALAVVGLAAMILCGNIEIVAVNTQSAVLTVICGISALISAILWLVKVIIIIATRM